MVVRALYACSREMTRVHERLRVLDRLSESRFAGFLGILRMASGSWIGNGCMSVVCGFTRDDESPRAFTRVYKRWTDCLNQDLPDSWGFSGWRVLPGSGMVVRALYACSREITRVHERLREFTSVSMRSLKIQVVPGASIQFQRALHRGPSALHESPRAFTRVYECWTDCLNQDLPDSWGFSGWRVLPGSGMVVRALYACSREITRVHERLRVLDRLSESGFAGFLGILRMASGSWIGNGRTSVVCVFTRDDESPRAFTSVYERWTDCLNQDLPDSWGFSGWRVLPGSGMVVRALYACSLEIT